MVTSPACNVGYETHNCWDPSLVECKSTLMSTVCHNQTRFAESLNVFHIFKIQYVTVEGEENLVCCFCNHTRHDTHDIRDQVLKTVTWWRGIEARTDGCLASTQVFRPLSRQVPLQSPWGHQSCGKAHTCKFSKTRKFTWACQLSYWGQRGAGCL